ncbi:MAG: hypothetical protein MJ240_14135, partial [Kiritimatiellae bacterium]|nr:hypothetical protein [Kiritimatiellia bacterium]
LGARKKTSDGLLAVVARLVRAKAQEFRVAEGRILAAGVDSGADAAWTLLAQEPDLFARALLAGSGAVPAVVAAKVSAQVRLYLGEMDRHSPPAATQASVAQLGNGLGHPADVRVLPGKNHKALIDAAFDDEALSWLLQLSP